MYSQTHSVCEYISTIHTRIKPEKYVLNPDNILFK